MTKCGHVFCRHCLLQYFDDDTGRKWKKCPICVELISCEDSQLKSTALELVVPCKPGDSRTFVLVERMRHSTLAALRQPGEGPIGSLLYETDPSAKFSRIAIAEAVSARIDHQSLELLARAREAQQSQDLSYPYLLHVMQQMQVSNVARVASESAAQPASKPPREKRVSSNSPWSDSEDEAEPATPEVDAAAAAAAAAPRRRSCCHHRNDYHHYNDYHCTPARAALVSGRERPHSVLPMYASELARRRTLSRNC